MGFDVYSVMPLIYIHIYLRGEITLARPQGHHSLGIGKSIKSLPRN